MLENGPMESFSLKNRNLIEQAVGIALVALLVFFCLLVLKPFVSAILWAAILVFASWPDVFPVVQTVARLTPSDFPAERTARIMAR